VADSAAGVPAITSRRLWMLLLAVGAPIWLVAAVITGITEDTILLSSVVLLGGFLVPIAMVVFALSRPRVHLTIEVVLLGFLGGGHSASASRR
jgi:protease PrsW